MTDEKIFDQVLKKADNQGYRGWNNLVPAFHDPNIKDWEKRIKKLLFVRRFEIIYSHDFAKAFWGEESHHKFEYAPEFAGENKFIIAWQFHLQQLVLEDNPIEYLSRFL